MNWTTKGRPATQAPTCGWAAHWNSTIAGEGEQRRHLDEERADEEVDEIGAPSVAEDGLLAAGEETLERDEERRVGDEVQEEPVETQERPGAELAVEGDVRSAEQRGDEGEADAGEAHPLAPAQPDADDPQQERGHEHDVKQGPNVRQGIQAAQLGHREQRRVMEAEDAAEPDQAEDDRPGPADPPRAEMRRFGLRRGRRLTARPARRVAFFR